MVVINRCFTISVVDLINEVSRIVKVFKSVIQVQEWPSWAQIQMLDRMWKTSFDEMLVLRHRWPFVDVLRPTTKQFLEISHQEVVLEVTVLWATERIQETGSEKANLTCTERFLVFLRGHLKNVFTFSILMILSCIVLSVFLGLFSLSIPQLLLSVTLRLPKLHKQFHIVSHESALMIIVKFKFVRRLSMELNWFLIFFSHIRRFFNWKVWQRNWRVWRCYDWLTCELGWFLWVAIFERLEGFFVFRLLGLLVEIGKLLFELTCKSLPSSLCLSKTFSRFLTQILALLFVKLESSLETAFLIAWKWAKKGVFKCVLQVIELAWGILRRWIVHSLLLEVVPERLWRLRRQMTAITWECLFRTRRHSVEMLLEQVTRQKRRYVIVWTTRKWESHEVIQRRLGLSILLFVCRFRCVATINRWLPLQFQLIKAFSNILLNYAASTLLVVTFCEGYVEGGGRWKAVLALVLFSTLNLWQSKA